MEKRQTLTDKAFEAYTEMMIEQIESVSKDWQRPWLCEGLQWACNLDGKQYNGTNAFFLMLVMQKHEYTLPVFGTYNRFNALNFQERDGKKVLKTDKDGNKLPFVCINKGEKSFPVVFTSFTCINAETREKIPYADYQKMDNEEQKLYDVYPRMQVYSVFNIAQTNLKEARPEMYEKIEKEYHFEPLKGEKGEIFAPFDTLLKEQAWHCPIKEEHSDSAFYDIRKNEITIPERTQFKDGESFCGTAFHEMAHSTGQKDLLNRFDSKNGWGEENGYYAKEELIAELTAAIVCARYGITKHVKDDSAAYLKSWLDCLKQEPNYLKNVLKDVRKATTMLTKAIDSIAERDKVEVEEAELCVA